MIKAKELDKKGDYEQAFHLFQNLSGNKESVNYLGNYYEFGKYVKPDITKAYYYYQESANAKNPAGLYNLGRLYLDGKYVVKDHKKAFELFSESAKLDYNPAMNSLGMMYLGGFYVSKNKRKALELIKKSAEFGNAEAQYNLECYYFYKETDSDRAMLCLRQTCSARQLS